MIVTHLNVDKHIAWFARDSMSFHATWKFSSRRCKYDRSKWPIKYGWHAHFQNSRGYFTTKWTTFAVDNELKIDNKLLFTITSPFNIIEKVIGTIEAVLNVDDKADEDDFENDTNEEDIVDDEHYKEKDDEEKDEDDKDDVDDDDKVVKLASMNEEHFYQDDDSMVLISSNKDEDDEELPKSQTPWLHEHINWKNISNWMVATKSVNYNTSAIQTQLNMLWN